MISRVIITVLTWLLLAAHYSRADNTVFMILSLLVPLLLLVRKFWAHLALVILTLAASLVWVATALRLINQRINAGDDWTRMAIILFAVALFTIFSAVFLNSRKIKERYNYPKFK